MTYILPPRSQKILPKRSVMTTVIMNLTALEGAFLQYDKFCFHIQAINCVIEDYEYWKGNVVHVNPVLVGSTHLSIPYSS